MAQDNCITFLEKIGQMKKYKRFFAFGCSFTNYIWPTWANIIAHDLQIPSQNWGFAGLGNVGIHHRMTQADIINSFNPDDLIITTWSSWHREDRYKGDWIGVGNVFNAEKHYDKKFLKKHWHENNDIIKNSNAIIVSNKLFNINYQNSLTEHDSTTYDANPLFEFYKKHLPVLTEFPRIKYTERWGGVQLPDNHPDIYEHMIYVRDHIYPTIGLTMKSSTVNYYKDMFENTKHKLSVAHIDLTNRQHVRKFFDEEFNNLLNNRGDIYTQAI